MSQPRRRPVPDRARRRAIRAEAARAGVPYNVAARTLAARGPAAGGPVAPSGLAPGEILASEGRTVYPAGSDTHRRWLVESRARWPLAQRLRDARRAADLPAGRAAHLVDRFPPTRGEPGTGVGPLYAGAGREDLLAMLYVVAAHEEPDALPDVGDLAWEAEMGEETAVDTACAVLDRAARRVLDGDRDRLPGRLADALAAARTAADWRLRAAAARSTAARLTAALRSAGPRLAVVGARQVLDAVLVVADDGHAPGTRVRLLLPADSARPGTIVGARWGPAGPPYRYLVVPDGEPAVEADPDDLAVPAAGW
jgi:hypothetical protein